MRQLLLSLPFLMTLAVAGLAGGEVLGATLAWNWLYGHEGCNSPGAENPGACRAVTSFGGGAMGLICGLI